jgi:hypothetical protein
VTNSTATNTNGPTNGAARRHAAPSRRPPAVVGSQPARVIVCAGRATTTSGAATAMTSRCWTMCPVKLLSAADSSHGEETRTMALTPAVHAHSRHPTGCG